VTPGEALAALSRWSRAGAPDDDQRIGAVEVLRKLLVSAGQNGPAPVDRPRTTRGELAAFLVGLGAHARAEGWAQQQRDLLDAVLSEVKTPSSAVRGTIGGAEAERIARLIVDAVRRTPMATGRTTSAVIADALVGMAVEVQP